MNTKLFTAFIGILAASTSYAELPHTFTANTPAKAYEVNSNFSNLDNRVTAIEAGQVNQINLNCSSDPSSINSALNSNFNKILITSGICTVDPEFWLGPERFLEITGNGIDSGFSSSVPFVVKSGTLHLIDMQVYGNIQAKDGAHVFISSTNITCSNLDKGALGMWMSTARIENNSFFSGCRGLDIRNGSAVKISDSIVDSAVDIKNLLIREGSSVHAARTEFRGSASTGSGHTNNQIDSNSRLSLVQNSSITGNIYMNASDLIMTDSSWYTDGSGLTKEIAAHRLSSLNIGQSQLGTGEISMPYGGSFFFHSNSTITNNVNISLDTAPLFMSGSHSGNISIYAVRSRVQLWEGNEIGTATNTANIHIGDYSTFGNGVTNYTGALTCADSKMHPDCPL